MEDGEAKESRTARPVHVADRGWGGGVPESLPPIFVAAESDPCFRLPITMKPSGRSRSSFSLAILRLGICTTQPPSLVATSCSTTTGGKSKSTSRRGTWTHFPSNGAALLVEGSKDTPPFFSFLFTSP